jgi:Peptidase family M23
MHQVPGLMQQPQAGRSLNIFRVHDMVIAATPPSSGMGMRSLVLALMASVIASGRAEAQLGLVPFDVRVPKPPTAFASDGKTILIYELRVTNLGRTDRGLQRIEALVDNAVVASWSSDSLKGIALRVGEAPGKDARVLGAGRQVILYLMVSVPGQSSPNAILHRFYTTPADSLDITPRDTLTGPTVTVETTPPVMVSPPLKGGPWVAANGPGNLSGHRRTVIPIQGLARVAQRFATDWILLGADGRLWLGDSTRNENWYGYRQPLLAVAEAMVVDVKDGIPENVPLAPKRAVPITLETVGGNYVILDLGAGRYAFYAHMVPGSATVKVGDRVTPGQVIGLLGNSGNSDAPHLHFHVGDAPSPLGTEGIPFVIDSFEKLGTTPEDFLKGWKASGPAEPKKGELPMQNHVVRFRTN